MPTFWQYSRKFCIRTVVPPNDAGRSLYGTPPIIRRLFCFLPILLLLSFILQLILQPRPKFEKRSETLVYTINHRNVVISVKRVKRFTVLRPLRMNFFYKLLVDTRFINCHNFKQLYIFTIATVANLCGTIHLAVNPFNISRRTGIVPINNYRTVAIDRRVRTFKPSCDAINRFCNIRLALRLIK